MGGGGNTQRMMTRPERREALAGLQGTKEHKGKEGDALGTAAEGWGREGGNMGEKGLKNEGRAEEQAFCSGMISSTCHLVQCSESDQQASICVLSPCCSGSEFRFLCGSRVHGPPSEPLLATVCKRQAQPLW